MRLVEQGKIDLSAPVRTYLPDFRVQDEKTSREVAIWHLLTHTPGWEGQLTTQDRGTETLAFFVTSASDLPQLAPAGTVWSYNNAGFTVAGRVIEVVTGQSIHEAIRKLVFEPIGLTRAFTRLEDVATYRFSVAHRTQDGKPVVVRPLTRSSSVTAGGVSMSLNDLLDVRHDSIWATAPAATASACSRARRSNRCARHGCARTRPTRRWGSAGICVASAES